MAAAAAAAARAAAARAAAAATVATVAVPHPQPHHSSRAWHSSRPKPRSRRRHGPWAPTAENAKSGGKLVWLE